MTLMNSSLKTETKNSVVDGRASKEMNQLSASFDVLVCGDGERAIFDALDSAGGLIDADRREFAIS